MIVWSTVQKNLKACYPVETDNLADLLTYLYCDLRLPVQQIVDSTQGECCYISLLRKMKELGIPIRKKGGKRHIKQCSITRDEYLTHSYKELALKYGVSMGTIRNRCRRYINGVGKKTKRGD